MNEASIRIGVDLGGTAIKVGAIRSGVVLRPAQTETPHEVDSCMQRTAELIREVSGGTPGGPVGIGIPGVIDLSGRLILNSPNLRFLDEVPFVDPLEQQLGVPVHLENDANCATLGEARHGAGKDHPSFLLATIGTGIGGGMVLNGKLFRGSGGMAGEFGHVHAGHDRLCGCGARGCAEAIVSATALVRSAHEKGIRIQDLRELSELARQGDKQAMSVFRNAGSHLGAAFAQATLLTDIRVFLLGGGGSPVTDLLRPTALQALTMRAFGRSAEDFLIKQAVLGNQAGIIGAAEIAGERELAQT